MMIVPISFFYVVRMDTTAAAAAAAARTYFVVEHPIFHTDALCAVSSSCCRRSGRGSFDRGGKSGPSVAIASHLWRVIRGSRVCVCGPEINPWDMLLLVVDMVFDDRDRPLHPNRPHGYQL